MVLSISDPCSVDAYHTQHLFGLCSYTEWCQHHHKNKHSNVADLHPALDGFLIQNKELCQVNEFVFSHWSRAKCLMCLCANTVTAVPTAKRQSACKLVVRPISHRPRNDVGWKGRRYHRDCRADKSEQHWPLFPVQT